MRVAGVICEYNPFHNGHALHLAETRNAGATHIVAVMSGNYVQRGEGAFCDKWARARAAVQCGADLVLDLPVPWAVGGAKSFARGGAASLLSFGIDFLSFGCETADRSLLLSAAHAVSREDVLALAGTLMREGIPYPAALQSAVGSFYDDKTADVLRFPNNVLALEYICAIRESGSSCNILPVLRQGAAHDAESADGAIRSAASIRALPQEKAVLFMPWAAVNEVFAPKTLRFDPAAYETAVLCALRQKSREEMRSFVDDRSGLADRIYAASRTARSLPELLETAKTKSLTLAKVRRAVMQIFLEIPPSFSMKAPGYLRALACNERGLELLRGAKPQLPLITKYAETSALDDFSKQIYALQCRTSDVYAALCKEKGACSLEQTNAMQIIR